MADGEQDDDSQKTEDPSQRRLEESRRKGQVVMSREVNNFVMLTAATILIAASGGSVMAKLRDHLKTYLEMAAQMPQAPGGLGHLLGDSFRDIFGILAFPFIILMAAAIVGPMIQIGPLFAPQLIMPDLGRVSPMQGFKRLFSMRALMEFFKGLLKISIIGAVGVIILKPYYANIDHLVGQTVPFMLNELAILFVKMMTGVLITLMILAIVDALYQRHEHFKKMRMTKQELKEEYKQTEGDPHVKARLRQLRSEKARQRMMQNVPKADVVITNPTHFAIALQYKPDEMEAPVCIAKGIDALALRIRETAKENDVVIVENPPLARVLYDTVEIDQAIPAEHYKAVAEVISYVFRLKGRLR